MRLNQVTLSVDDVERCVAFYRALGFRQIVGAPDYARLAATEGDGTFSLHRAAGMTREPGATLYFECDALDARVAALKNAGIRFLHDPVDQPWLWREARLADPAGNVICLYYAGSNRLDPPWRLQS